MPLYKLNGKTYNIPDDVVSNFEKDNPDATIGYSVGDKKYEIPVSKRDGFLQAYPKAVLTGLEQPSVEQTKEANENATKTTPTYTFSQAQLDSMERTPMASDTVLQQGEQFREAADQIGSRAAEDEEVVRAKQGLLRDQVGNTLPEIEQRLDSTYNAAVERAKEATTPKSGVAKFVHDLFTPNRDLISVMGVEHDIARKDPEVQALTTAKKYLDDSRSMIAAADRGDENFFKGAARGFGEKFMDLSTWDFGITELENNKTLRAALDKADNGEELTDAERSLLDAAAVKTATDMYFGSYLSRGYKAGSVTAESIPFMIEMAANPLSATGKTAASKMLRYTINRFGRKAATSGLGKAGLTVARGVGDIAGAAGMAATTGSVRVAADAERRQMGDIQFDENPDADRSAVFTYGGHTEGDDYADAWRKAFLGTTIENYSEMVGAYFAPALNIAGKGVRKGIDKIGLKKVNELVDNVKGSDLGRLVSDFETRTQWNGTIGEYAEEVAGGIMNALLVGDQTLDTDERTGVFNLDNNIDTFLGVALMGGVISAVKTAGYRTPKYRARQDMMAKDDAAAAAFGNQEKWGEIRNTIAFGTDEDVEQKVKDIVNDADLTPEQRQAALEYVKAAEMYKGMLKGEEIRRADADPLQVDAETSFDNGYSLEDEQEKNDAKNMLDYQRQKAVDTFGETKGLDEDPIATLQTMRDGGYTPEQLQVAIDYVNAKATYDGMIQRVRDDIDGRIVTSDAMIESRRNREDGMIHPATMKTDDRKVYVIGGKLVMNEDGTMIDYDQSDESVIIRDAATGAIEFADPHDVLSTDEALDAAQEKEAAQEAIRQQYAQEAANKIDGVLPFNVGDTYQVLDEQGQPHTVTVVAAAVPQPTGQAEGNGDVTVSIDGGEPVAYSREAIQQMAENANLARLQQYEQEQAAHREEQAAAEREANRPVYNLNDEVTLQTEEGTVRGSITAEPNVDGQYEVFTEEPVNGRKINLFTRDELDGMVVEHNSDVPAGEPAGTTAGGGTAEAMPLPTGQAEGEEGGQEAAAGQQVEAEAGEPQRPAIERIPVVRDGNGHPVLNRRGKPQYLWHEAPVGDTADALTEQAGGDMLTARDVATDMTGKAKADLEKVRKQKPKGDDPIELIESRNAIRQAEQQAQDIVKYWQDVNQELQKRMSAEAARKQAEAEAAKSERQRQQEAEAKRQQEERLDEIERQRIREAIEKEHERRNREYEPLVRARKEMADDPDALAILDDTEPRDLEEWVSYLLRPHSILWQDASDNEVGLRSELGLKRGDMQRFMTLLGTKESGAKPFGKVVLDIYEGLPDAIKEHYTDQDVRNALLELFNEGSSGRMMNLAKEHRIEEARSMYQENLRRSIEAEMEAWAEAYHLTAEERETFEDYMQQPPTAVDEEIINQIIADNEQNRRSEEVDREPVGGRDAGGSGRGESQVRGEAEVLGKVFPADRNAKSAAAEGGEQASSGDNVAGGTQGPVAPAEHLKPTDLRDAVRPESAELGVNEANARAREGAGMTDEEVETVINSMKTHATAAPSIEVTDDNWRDNIQTPLGDVKMGENQKEKLFVKGREQQYGMLLETLANPDVVLEEQDKEPNMFHERSSSYLFVKTFQKPDGSMYVHFESVTVSQDGMEVSISSHIIRENQLRNKLKSDRLLYRATALDEPANSSAEQPTSEGSGLSSVGKDTEKSETKQGNKEKSSVQGTDYSEEEILNAIRGDLEIMLEDAGLDDVVIKGMALHGSRKRGDAREDSDLDVVVEYEGNASEDGLFNLFNETPIEIDGIRVDVNPITRGKSGTLVQYMERSRRYDEEKRMLGKTSSAEEIASEEAKVDTNPTEAQKEAGNYKKGHINFDGYDITIENPKGSVRSGTDGNGNHWETTMHNTYGYIRGTEGVDGDHIDVFLSDNPTSGNVFVVDQVNPETGEFDEHKVMYGFADMESARKAYLANYSKGWQGMGAITAVSREEFKKWVESSHRKTKPFADYKSVKPLGGQNDGVAMASQQTEQSDTQAEEVIREQQEEQAVDEKEISRTASGFVQETPEQAAEFDKRVPDMSDEELLAYMSADGHGDVNKAYHMTVYDEYDYRHSGEQTDAYDAYTQMLHESATTKEQAEEMLAGIRSNMDALATDERPMLLGQEEALQEYIDELEAQDENERFRDDEEDIEAVNEQFNERLDELDKDRNQKDRVLHLGHPGTFLLNGGIADGEIVMDFDRFVRKSSENYGNSHPFTAEDIKDLPKAINAPIAVFESSSNTDKVILTELKKDGKNFIVAIRTTSQPRKGGVTLEINEITTLYPKNAKGIVKWIIDGRHTQIDKEKALRWIEALRPHVGTPISEEHNSESSLLRDQQRTILADVDSKELDSAAKVVENFENPKLSEENSDEDNVFFREVDDEDTIRRLDSEPTIKVYRSMQLIDGKLYPPMSAKVDGKLRQPSEIGKWEEAEERPEMADENGYFTLNKGNGKSLKARYNPYIHTSRTMLNDQFSEAQDRDNLVVVEMEVPVSELTSGYKAEKAKDSVGAKQWKAGIIQGQLTGTREVILSRWAKPVRIVPVEEVADSIAEQIEGQVSVMPTNVVTPQQREALEARGVKFVETDNKGKIKEGVNVGKSWKSVYGKKRSGRTMQREGVEVPEGNTSGTVAKRRTAAQERKAMEYAQRQWRRAHEVANEWMQKLGLGDVMQVVESIGEVEGNESFSKRKRRAKGWYDPKTGKIVIVLGNHRSPSDVLETILHEAVGHYGLRQLFGQNFDTFLDNVLENANLGIKERIAAMAADLMAKERSAKKSSEEYMRVATEEYLSHLAENTDFERATNSGWWQTIKECFLKMLHSLGLPGFTMKEEASPYGVLPGMKQTATSATISDNELRYILWRSYENLAEPGRYRNPFREAEDVSKQTELGVGNQARTVRMGHIEDEIPQTVMSRKDEEKIRERVKKMSAAEARAAYERINAQMLDEEGLDLDEHFEKTKRDWIAEHGIKGVGKQQADELQKAMDKYGSGMVELRWELLDRLEELGVDVAMEESRMRDEGDIEAINERFNKDLDSYIKGDLPTGYRFELGYPSVELRSAGFDDLPISMRASLLARKAGDESHPFDASDLRDLVNALQKPIAIFSYSKDNMRNLIVDVSHGDKHFLVGVTLDYRANGIEINSVSGLFPKESHEWIKWIQDGKALRIDQKDKVQDLIDSLRTNPAESERIGLNLDSAAKVVKDFENPKLSEENSDEGGVLFRDDEDEDVGSGVDVGREGFDEWITRETVRLASEHKDSLQMRINAMKAIGGNLSKLRQAMSRQREYDRETVNRVVRLARMLMDTLGVDSMTRGEVRKLTGLIAGAAGKEDIMASAKSVVDLMVAHQLRELADMLHRQLSVRGTKLNGSGVEVQGRLDIEGKRMVDAMKEGMSQSADALDERIADCLDRMGGVAVAQQQTGQEAAINRDAQGQEVADVSAKNAAVDYQGYLLAKKWHEAVKSSEEEEADLKRQLKDAKEQLKSGEMERSAYREFEQATDDALRENRLSRMEGYYELLGNLGDGLGSSIARAKAWRDREMARVRDVQHNANSDMQGRSASEHSRENWGQKLSNLSIVRFFLKPLATFDQMLRLFGGRHVNGEGYLWKRFMGGYTDASDREWRELKRSHERLDEKVSEVFGRKMRWSDLFAVERKLPGMDVEFWDGGEKVNHELTQGNMLYIYMVNKMSDGRMKLRKMGITESDVEAILDRLDPRFVELGDWIQDVFLKEKRNEYNKVHERLFGASMAAIDAYFPLVINSRSRGKDEDVGEPEKGETQPATITGAIIKRTKNSLALDVTGADAFDVVLAHLQQMEHWAAFSELNHDLNTLLSYRKFRNRVLNMTTVQYGSGETLWQNFKDVCRIAAGVYRPMVSRNSLDSAMVNVAKGVTQAKISFRLYTALKQLLSYPAYLSEASVVELAKTTLNPLGAVRAWNWAMSELPGFSKRWQSRRGGDSRLQETDADWRFWKNKLVETAGRWGMTPNAFIDGLTVAMGAKAIYETKLKSLKKAGYSDSDAKDRALRAAAVSYNETQQSSENAYLSAMQLDRTVASVALTVFRNASMAYQRRLTGALRNLKHKLTPGFRGESIAFMVKQMMRDGLSEGDARKAAVRAYNRSWYRDVADVALFGFVMQLAWNLGPYLPYLLLGDGDDDKDEMKDDAVMHALAGGVEGLTAGNVMSDLYNMKRKGDDVSNYQFNLLPLMSDVQSMVRHMKSDEVQAANDLLNLLVQSGVGVNPQTFSDVWVALMDYGGESRDESGRTETEREKRIGETSREFGLLVMRLMQVPQSQIDKYYIDELGMNAREARGEDLSVLAERYAKYKVSRGAAMLEWVYGEDERSRAENRYLKKFEEMRKERVLKGLDPDDMAVIDDYKEGEYRRWKSKKENARLKYGHDADRLEDVMSELADRPEEKRRKVYDSYVRKRGNLLKSGNYEGLDLLTRKTAASLSDTEPGNEYVEPVVRP